MSRQASRRPEVTPASKLIPAVTPSEPPPRPEGVEMPPAPTGRIWVYVLWFWAAMFALLMLSEIVMFCLRKLG